MPRDTQNASESLYMRWKEKNYHYLITIYLLTTNNMLWIGPYDKKHQNHGIDLTGAQDSAGVPRFTSHHLSVRYHRSQALSSHSKYLANIWWKYQNFLGS